MSDPVSIKKSGSHILVTTPYSRAFMLGAKALGGVWDSAVGAWTFDACDSTRVQTLCRVVFGLNGVSVELELHCSEDPPVTTERPRQKEPDIGHALSFGTAISGGD